MNSCDRSYIWSVYSQCHADLLKCTEQNVNNQNVRQVSQLYVPFCFKESRSLIKSAHWGCGRHVICSTVYLSGVSVFNM